MRVCYDIMDRIMQISQENISIKRKCVRKAQNKEDNK